MSELMRKPPTNSIVAFQLIGPMDKTKIVSDVEKLANRHGLKIVHEEYLTFEEAFPDFHPGDVIVGLRYREGLTQAQLAQLTGIPQRHISEIENGKREIGKARAKVLAKVLNTNYKNFLVSESNQK